MHRAWDNSALWTRANAARNPHTRAQSRRVLDESEATSDEAGIHAPSARAGGVTPQPAHDGRPLPPVIKTREAKKTY